MATGPLTDDEKRRIRDLHAAGVSRNDIATQLGRSGSTITKAATDLGLSFDRAATKAATEAKVADAKGRRATLMLDLLDDAQKLRGQLWQPHTYIEHGGKDFVRREWEQHEPSPQDKLKLMQAASTAAGTSLRLDQHDHETGDDAANSMIAALAAGLGAAYDQLHHTSDDGDGD